MASGVGEFFSRMYRGPQPDVSVVAVPADHCDGVAVPTGNPFETEQHYFTIRVKSVGLAAGRKWFASYLPLLTTACDFAYDGRAITAPHVVGPTLLAPAGRQPTAATLLDTRVCGAHPYAGGELVVTVVLSQVTVANALDRVLALVEKAGAAFDAAKALVPYLAVTEAVIGGLTRLVDDGDAAPLLGARMAMSQDNGSLRPGLVLVAATRLDGAEVWLRGRSRTGQSDASPQTVDVLVGDARNGPAPLAADHVVLAIEQSARRSDATGLPAVAEPWAKVENFARYGDGPSWLTAKTWLSALGQAMYLSPDLTRAEAALLYRELTDEAVRIRDEAVSLGHLGPDPRADHRLQILRNIDATVRSL